MRLLAGPRPIAPLLVAPLAGARRPTLPAALTMPIARFLRDQRATWFRLLVAAGQAATILITWPLWQVRAFPPALPALPLPQAPTGVALLASLLLVALRPAAGVALHTVLVVYALAADQLRIQPQIVSMVLLLWATLPSPGLQVVGRVHLSSMWIWAGLNKLASAVFLGGAGPAFFATFLPRPLAWLRPAGGYLIAGAELLTGLLVLVPRTRRWAAAAAFGLHLAILLTLSPLGRRMNVAIWPWNLVLAFAGIALVAPWHERPRETLEHMGWKVRAALILLFVAPAGFHLGITDAYLAHHLYTGSTPHASAPGLDFRAAGAALRVPVPRERRLFSQWFQRTCRPGDVLTIHDARWWYVRQGRAVTTEACAARASVVGDRPGDG